MNIEQHAAEIASMYPTRELRRFAVTLTKIIEAREATPFAYAVHVPRWEQRVTLGPVSASELVAMTARGE